MAVSIAVGFVGVPFWLDRQLTQKHSALGMLGSGRSNAMNEKVHEMLMEQRLQLTREVEAQAEVQTDVQAKTEAGVVVASGIDVKSDG